MLEILVLLFRTVLLRPYVFLFLGIYLVAASHHLGWRRASLFVPLGYSLAWLSEFSSIHWGFPYGDYYYIPATLGKELWVFGVPFMDSLSYVFLAYCSFSTAIFVLSPVAFAGGDVFMLETHTIRRSWQALLLGSFLFVLLDIIIDPVALLGQRWFLGQIYGYRETGIYFGIPLSNFGGWLLVGFVMVAALQMLDSLSSLEPQEASLYRSIPGMALLGPILYISVLAFNLVVTFWIGETLLGMVGFLAVFYPLMLSVFFTLYKHANLTPVLVEKHIREFPFSRAVCLMPFSLPKVTACDHPVDIIDGEVQESSQNFSKP